MIVGVTGHAQHGKDTFAAVAVEQFGYTRMAFADNVRRALWALNPVVPRRTRYTTLRAVVGDGGELGYGPGWDRAKQDPHIRGLLQRMGTEAVRDIVHTDAWIMALERHVFAARDVVIPDVRFPNEANAIRRWGGVVIRVVRVDDNGEVFVAPGVSHDHPSERSVDDIVVVGELRAADVDAAETLAAEALGSVTSRV